LKRIIGSNDPSRPRIFQIGMNRCGTMSLHYFLEANGFCSGHHDDTRSRYTLAQLIERARVEGKPLLHYLPHYDALTDMDFLFSPTPLRAYRHFSELDRQYPGSRFILNTRDEEDWIRSRKGYRGGFFITGWRMSFDFLYNQIHGLEETTTEEAREARWFAMREQQFSSVLSGFSSVLSGVASGGADGSDSTRRTVEEIVALWRAERTQQHAEVTEWFADRPDDLLVFDIERDDPAGLAAFLGLEGDLVGWGQHNRGVDNR
jgi:hypothetical protein